MLVCILGVHATSMPLAHPVAGQNEDVLCYRALTLNCAQQVVVQVHTAQLHAVLLSPTLLLLPAGMQAL